jgi:hypothetical protein
MNSSHSGTGFPVVFTRRLQRWTLTLSFVAIGIATMSGMTYAGVGWKIYWGFLSAISLAFAYRAARSATVVAWADHVEIRSVFRRRNIPWNAIRTFNSTTGQAGLFRRRFLVIEQRNNEPLFLREYSALFPSSVPVIDSTASRLRELMTMAEAGGPDTAFT